MVVVGGGAVVMVVVGATGVGAGRGAAVGGEAVEGAELVGGVVVVDVVGTVVVVVGGAVVVDVVVRLWAVVGDFAPEVDEQAAMSRPPAITIGNTRTIRVIGILQLVSWEHLSHGVSTSHRRSARGSARAPAPRVGVTRRTGRASSGRRLGS